MIDYKTEKKKRRHQTTGETTDAANTKRERKLLRGEESYENFDFEIGTYLGRVDFDFGTPFSAKCRLYTLIEKPEYLFVDMGLIDWRIYKQSSY